jgi:DNA-binding transcriptional LysR family regulator
MDSDLPAPRLDSLKVFCDIARCRSFSRAAADNDLSQSAASQIVLQLEKRLGAQLISRATRPLKLTELGRVFFEGCQRVWEQYQDLEATIKQAQTQCAATVRVAAIYSVGFRDMNQYVQHFQFVQSGASVQIEYLHPDQVYEKVRDGTADLGLVSFPRKSRDLKHSPWREEEMVLACSPRHALSQNLAIVPEHLNGQKYIAFQKGLVIRRQVDKFLRAHGVTPEIVCEFDNIENIKKAVEINGIALLPEPTLRREVQAGTLVALPLVGAHLIRPLGIIQARHRKLSTTACRFLELLRQPEDGEETGARLNGTAQANGHGHGHDASSSRRSGTARTSSKKV